MIRLFKKEDKKELIALLKLHIPRYFDEAEEKEFVAYLDKEVESYFVFEENKRIIASGGINYFPNDKLARIAWDIVHPNFQGKGIGKKLTEYRINQIKQDPNVDLIIVRTTQLVYQFYQKMGFKLEKIEKDFWAKGFDLYQMRLALH